jgi:hypothetical protein
MKDKYYPPKYMAAAFHCPNCFVYANQIWCDAQAIFNGSWRDVLVDVAYCSHCNKWSYWLNSLLIFPPILATEPAHPDLPKDCNQDYQEARETFQQSPRASAALLRLCLQKLLPYLGEKGDNINSAIASLVSKGLPALTQKALDYCRVVGNNSVHPGQIDVNDSPDIALKLFSTINYIVEDRITRPKEIEVLYNQLPEDARKQIEERDAKNKK